MATKEKAHEAALNELVDELVEDGKRAEGPSSRNECRRASLLREDF